MEKEKLLMNTSSPPPLNYAGLSSPLPNWQSSSSVEAQLVEMNCGSEQFLNLNWENSMNQCIPFESTLRSIVSSPAASNSAVPVDSVVIRELIGRLGSICNNGEISPPQSKAMVETGGASYIGGNSNSSNTSCYGTPLDSPPKLNLSMMDHQIRGNLPVLGSSMASSLSPFSADPEFAERAAKFSCLGGLTGQFAFPEAELQYRSFPGMESGNLLRVPSSQSLKAGSQMGTVMQDGLEAEMRSASASGSASDRKFGRLSRSSTPDDVEFSNALKETSATEPSAKGPNEANARKRKASQRGKAKELPSTPWARDAKETEDDDSNAKRCKLAEATETGKDVVEAKAEQNCSLNEGSGGKNQTKDSSKPPEPPKQDYIHVRARRGQATDSHSLAERVRREKISERMKFLQDLVPGCNKVTGKAVMLDEIINYVQSLQRQVEFLSMKLAAVNPRLDFNMEALLSKDILQSHGSLPQTMYSLDSSASVFSYGQQPQQGPLPTVVSNGLETVNPLDVTLRRTLGMQLPAIDGHGNASSQLASLWEDDLQSVVHMGFGQNQEMAFPPQSFQGSLPTAHMKVEL